MFIVQHTTRWSILRCGTEHGRHAHRLLMTCIHYRAPVVVVCMLPAGTLSWRYTRCAQWAQGDKAEEEVVRSSSWADVAALEGTLLRCSVTRDPSSGPPLGPLFPLFAAVWLGLPGSLAWLWLSNFNSWIEDGRFGAAVPRQHIFHVQYTPLGSLLLFRSGFHSMWGGTFCSAFYVCNTHAAAYCKKYSCQQTPYTARSW